MEAMFHSIPKSNIGEKIYTVNIYLNVIKMRMPVQEMTHAQQDILGFYVKIVMY